MRRDLILAMLFFFCKYLILTYEDAFFYAAPLDMEGMMKLRVSWMYVLEPNPFSVYKWLSCFYDESLEFMSGNKHLICIWTLIGIWMIRTFVW